MRFRKYSIAWFTSALIVAMTGQVSVAFTITPSQPGATANWKSASSYVTEDIFGRTVYGTTNVSTRLWTEPLPLGGSQTFNTTLLNWSVLSERGFWGWDFKPAQQELMGSFEIQNYVACAPQDPCGIEAPPPNNIPRYDGIGALININYHPAPTDPQPGQNKIHWIQIVRTNFGSGIPGIIPGTWFIDNGLRRDNPYYDTIGMADENSFEDRPYNPIPFATSIENFFEAQLYLAEETTSSKSDQREVTIYNGIKWGWENKIEPRQDFCPANTTINENSISGNSDGSHCTAKLDLELLFDTTGSMGSYISTVQSTAKDILNKLDASGTDYRIAVADYKDFPDQGGYPYHADLAFSTDKTAITNSINSLSSIIGGGGDTPESAYSGLIRTINTEGLGTWRNGVKKAVIVMSDAPPHDPEPFTGYTSKDVVDAAYAVDPAIIYSIIPGGDPTAVSYFSKLSSQTGGKLYTTNSSTDITNALLDITTQVTDPSSGSTGGTVQSVPEPSSVKGLFTLILAGFGTSLLKRKKAVKVTEIN